MRIRLLTARASWANGKTEMQEYGQIITVGVDEASRMVLAGQAEYIEAPAVEATMETVVATPMRGRPRKNVETRNA